MDPLTNILALTGKYLVLSTVTIQTNTTPVDWEIITPRPRPLEESVYTVYIPPRTNVTQWKTNYTVTMVFGEVTTVTSTVRMGLFRGWKQVEEVVNPVLTNVVTVEPELSRSAVIFFGGWITNRLYPATNIMGTRIR